MLGVRASLIIVTIMAGCGGRISTQATNSRPDALTQDDANLYWTTWEGEVFSRSKSGGTPSLITSGRFYGLQRGIWVDDRNVYFISVDDATNRGALLEAPLTGGTPAVVADSTSAAADGSGVYWVEGAQTVSQPEGIVIRRRDTSGVISTVATAPLGPVWQLALDDTYVYWADDREIVRAPKLGGSIDVLATAGSGREIFTVTVDDTRAYYATCDASACDTEDAAVLSVGKNGSGSTITYSVNEPMFAAPPVLAVDATHVYWLSSTSSGTSSKPQTATASIRAAPKDASSPPVTIFDGDAGSVSDFVVDGARLYWTAPLKKAVEQMPKQ